LIRVHSLICLFVKAHIEFEKQRRIPQLIRRLQAKITHKLEQAFLDSSLTTSIITKEYQHLSLLQKHAGAIARQILRQSKVRAPNHLQKLNSISSLFSDLFAYDEAIRYDKLAIDMYLHGLTIEYNAGCMQSLRDLVECYKLTGQHEQAAEFLEDLLVKEAENCKSFLGRLM